MAKSKSKSADNDLQIDNNDVTPDTVKNYEAGKPTSTMTETTQQKIERMRLELETLEKTHEQEQKSKLMALPEQLGFKNMNALVAALMPFTRNYSPKAESTTNPAATGTPGTPRKRTTVTPEMKASIIEDFRDSVMTGSQVAAKYGVSTATVATIKREAGLTKK